MKTRALFAPLGAFPVMLAPMAGISDLPYRSLCREMGCDFTYTEMISAKGLSYENRHTHDMLITAENERPCAVQLFGREPGLMADIARRLCEEYAGELACIDINMGCPAQKIVKNGEGSALMLEPELAGRIMKAVAKASSLPVTAKFRKGFDAEHINAVEFARVLADNGATALTVHGRTREQMYSGRADYGVIAAVRDAVDIPVFGNGDLFSGADALRMLRETGCDGFMVARGAMGNPFIFREIKSVLAGGDYTPPSEAERLETAMLHTRRMCAFKGEYGVIEMRKHIACYLKGMKGAAIWRVRANGCRTEQELLDLLRQYGEELLGR